MQVGLAFYICIFWTSSSIFGAVYVFPFEKYYLIKERKADMYRLSVYYACSTICDMVAHVLYPTFFMVILYFMAGFKRTVACFFLTLFSILLIAITSQVSHVNTQNEWVSGLLIIHLLTFIILLPGSRRTIWSCNYECSKSRDNYFFNTNVIPSHKWLLYPGTYNCFSVKAFLTIFSTNNFFLF